MGLTRRRDSYYVEFPVLDDGKTLTLARGIVGAKLKRWKVGSVNRTVAKQQEAEAASYTGLSVHTVYAMVSQRRIPFVKVGRLLKFDLGLLDGWIQQNTIMPMPPRRA